MKSKIFAAALLIGVVASLGPIHSTRASPTAFAGAFLDAIEEAIISVALATSVIWITGNENDDPLPRKSGKVPEHKAGMCRLTL